MFSTYPVKKTLDMVKIQENKLYYRNHARTLINTNWILHNQTHIFSVKKQCRKNTFRRTITSIIIIMIKKMHVKPVDVAIFIAEKKYIKTKILSMPTFCN